MITGDNIVCDGKILPWESANIHVSDKAMWFDFGIYESIKVIKGHPIDSEDHINRLFASAEIIDMRVGFSKKDVIEWVFTLCKVNQIDDALIRIIAFGDTEENRRCRLYMYNLGLTFYPDSYYKKGVSLITYQGERKFPKAKSIDLLINFVALRKAKRLGSLDALLVDNSGFVTEGTRTNIFFIRNRIIYAPPERMILDGVVRKYVLEIIKKNSIHYIEREISNSEISSFDECFITSTSTKVMPVVQIDGKKINSGVVGPLSKSIIQLYRQHEKELIKKYE